MALRAIMAGADPEGARVDEEPDVEEINAEETDEVLIEEVSIDGMCGVD